MKNTMQIGSATFLVSRHFTGDITVNDVICSDIIWRANKPNMV